MRKYWYFLVILLIAIYITFTSVCNVNTLNLLVESIKDINYFFLFLLLLFCMLYFVFQGFYTKTILKSLNTNISLLKGIFYSMVEFYFSGITPSSTGGQPLQMYFMKKDGIPESHSMITLILNTIFFKLVLVTLGIFILIYKGLFLINYSPLYLMFFLLGFIGDICMVYGCYLLLFNQKIIKKILLFINSIILRIPIIGRKLHLYDVDTIASNYRKQTEYILHHKKQVFITFIITFLQRMLFFSSAYLVYRGLGFSDISYLNLLAIQVCVQISMELFPLPGGTALSETMFKDLFGSVFSIGVAEVGMIFTRLFVFYLPLIVCFIVFIIGTFRRRKQFK